ncbi:uncharacterized protein LOC111392180 [Olea europaea var. sylvestris]|uniref:uncharacterized protein LOC111392180 n=1 Tax=Olea europaea var. sylvestris TaxID=158386 RepID=UPI000C1CE0AF|nr:uncharacterized protein LOC111392180 [Olea europaea var. sylvestris]
MRAFLKSLDEHVWVSVQNGWKPPSTTVSGTVNLTDKSLWTKDEIAECNWNSKGLHALFMTVSPEEFKRVSMCETAKEVWDILETTHEGTKTKGKSIALKSIKEDESSDTESLRDDEIAYFVKKFQKVLKNRRKPQDRKSGVPSRFSKEKTERFNNKGSSDKPCLVRCHECQDNESETNDRQESSSSEDEGNYMAFVSTVKSESDKESDKVEEELHDDNSSNEDEDDIDIQEAYQLLFKEKDKVKTLASELEKSNAHLQTFISGTKKLDNLLGMNKPVGDRRGHTRTRCYKLGNEHRNQNIPSQVSFLSNQVSHLTEMLTKLTRSTLSPKKVWVKKGDLARHSGQEHCYVAHVALKAQNYNMWYLDSARSRHMCGNKALFTTLDECNGGMVTFEDGGSAPILGKGLKSNLLSISKICDADFEVSFVQKRCTVSAKIDVSELWHKSLGHLNYKSLVQLAKKELVDGFPKIGPSENVVCGPCQLGKQLKESHKKTSRILTKRPLELIHMNLMGPSRTESLGGKRYILVVVDDFSRFTWIELLREKSDACDIIKSLCKRLCNELNLKVSRMHSDHGKEFEIFNLESFCMDEGILHEFSSPITP